MRGRETCKVRVGIPSSVLAWLCCISRSSDGLTMNYAQELWY